MSVVAFLDKFFITFLTELTQLEVQKGVRICPRVITADVVHVPDWLVSFADPLQLAVNQATNSSLFLLWTN